MKLFLKPLLINTLNFASLAVASEPIDEKILTFRRFEDVEIITSGARALLYDYVPYKQFKNLLRDQKESNLFMESLQIGNIFRQILEGYKKILKR